MRQQNTFEVRKTVSEQVTEIARLIWKFLARLSEVTYVTYEGIAGNHDRLNGNYKNALTGDTASTLINQIIRSLSEVTDGRVEYVEAKDYYFTDIDLMGYSFAFVHGDKHKVDSNNSVLSKLEKTVSKLTLAHSKVLTLMQFSKVLHPVGHKV